MKKTAEPYDCWRDGLRGRDLADCYKRFPDDLGPDEVALIQKYYPGFSTYVPKARMGDRIREIVSKNLVAYAIKGLKARKGVKFLNSLLSKNVELSYKQVEWRNNISKSNERYTRSMPDGFVVAPSYSSEVLFDPKKSSPAARAWVEKNVGYTEEGSYWSLLGKPVKAVSEPAPAPVTNTGDSADKIKVLDALLAKRPDGFMQSIRDQVARGRTLSDKQLKAVRQNLYRNRMRSEADLFRSASEALESTWFKTAATSKGVVMTYHTDPIVGGVRVTIKVETGQEKVFDVDAMELGNIIKQTAGWAMRLHKKAVEGLEQEIMGAFEGVKTKTFIGDFQASILDRGDVTMKCLGTITIEQPFRKSDDWNPNPTHEVEELLEQVARRYKVTKKQA